MYGLGCFESDLTDVTVFEVPKESILPTSYSVEDQIDEPHDQGSRGICVSVSTFDMCKYLYRGLGKPWQVTLDFFYNSRKDTAVDGMTPREAMEIAQRNRFIRSYAFLRNTMSIQYSILSNGPVMICLPVYNTSRDTFWEYRIGEAIVGFHAVTVVGYNLNGFRLRNSWGTSYGRGGYADFPYTDFGRIREAWTIFS